MRLQPSFADYPMFDTTHARLGMKLINIVRVYHHPFITSLECNTGNFKKGISKQKEKEKLGIYNVSNVYTFLGIYITLSVYT